MIPKTAYSLKRARLFRKDGVSSEKDPVFSEKTGTFLKRRRLFQKEGVSSEKDSVFSEKTGIIVKNRRLFPKDGVFSEKTASFLKRWGLFRKNALARASSVENRQVEPSKLLGVGNHVDPDDLSVRDLEVEHDTRLSALRPDEPRGSIHERRFCGLGTSREGSGHGRRAAAGERPTMAAISSKGTANRSCSTKATRSAGASVSSTTSSAGPTASVLGGLAILAPRLPRLKEWAYAGIAFDLTGAAVSNAAVGEPTAKVIVPLVLLGIAAASWLSGRRAASSAP